MCEPITNTVTFEEREKEMQQKGEEIKETERKKEGRQGKRGGRH